mgnify:CR=1 FL=1
MGKSCVFFQAEDGIRDSPVTGVQTCALPICSIAIDEDLLERVDIKPYEQVHIYNINTGSRFITYVITAKRGSGTFSINGAAARLAQINDRIIVAAYGNIDIDNEKYQPKVILLDACNQVIEHS